MPCYEVNLFSEQINMADRDALKKALKALGLEFVEGSNYIKVKGKEVYIYKDRIEYESQHRELVNKIKRGYSVEIVNKEMKKSGWVGTWKANFKIEVSKY